jgi:hypothetical protein
VHGARKLWPLVIACQRNTRTLGWLSHILAVGT